MGDVQRTTHRQIAINGDRYSLASEEDLGDLKQRIEDAAHAGGRFVDFTTAGGLALSALISPRSAVTIAVGTAEVPAEEEGEGVVLPVFGDLVDF